ncbi:nodulation receptor kinase [Tanacetum coccineum]
MLVEKKYPLKKEILEKMINLKIEAEEESSMAHELIKFIKSQIAEQNKFRAGAFDQLKYNATTVPGLAHLHSLSPRLAHKDFKTANVLVDENFIAKVADAGVQNFLGRGDTAGPSSQVTVDEIFLAPDSDASRKKSNIYSFGVFLLELVSGQEATELLSSDSNQNIVEWVRDHQEAGTLSSIIDPRLGNSFTAEGMEEYIQLIVRCVEVSSERRPTMSYIVTELDRILEKEMSLTTIMGEGTPVVTLGSQLFRAAK